eukprot:360633-Chlamydomonas_euryale.AAC.16
MLHERVSMLARKLACLRLLLTCILPLCASLSQPHPPLRATATAYSGCFCAPPLSRLHQSPRALCTGHCAVVHAATIGDNCLIGMGASVLDGATVGSGSIVAAGAVVTPRTSVPSGEVWAGVPAKFLRKLDADEAEFVAKSATNYSRLADVHRCGCWARETAGSKEDAFVIFVCVLCGQPQRWLGGGPPTPGSGNAQGGAGVGGRVGGGIAAPAVASNGNFSGAVSGFYFRDLHHTAAAELHHAAAAELHHTAASNLHCAFWAAPTILVHQTRMVALWACAPALLA